MADGRHRPEAATEHQHSSPPEFSHSGEKDLPPAVQNLADKETASFKGQGPDLKPEEKASLYSWRQFPDDPQLRALAAKETLSSYGGPDLTPNEKGDLYSAKQFPDDPHFRDLARREILEGYGGKPLTEGEASSLGAKRQFPNDAGMQALATKENMFLRGLSPDLKPEEKEQLMAARRSSPRFQESNTENMNRALERAFSEDPYKQ